MDPFTRLEEFAGHDLTMVSGPNAGVSTYYCEGCGALIQLSGSGDRDILFHVPQGSPSTEEACLPHVRGASEEVPSLKDKLRAREKADYERLKRDI